MKLAIILSIFALTQASTIRKKCNGVTINGAYYEREALMSDIYFPNMLAVDHNTDVLYFLNEPFPKDDKTDYEDESVNNVTIYDLKTKAFKTIDDMPSTVYYIAINEAHKAVYFGTDNDVYKYNHENNEVSLFANETFGMIQFADTVYLTDEYFGTLYSYLDGKFSKYELENDQVADFIVDKDKDVFYNNLTGLYFEKQGSGHSVLLKKVEPNVYPFAIDTHGKVYYCDTDGIYTANKKSADVQLTKILDIECYGLAFDSKNNMIVADETDTIYIYTPSDCNNGENSLNLKHVPYGNTGTLLNRKKRNSGKTIKHVPRRTKFQ